MKKGDLKNNKSIPTAVIITIIVILIVTGAFYFLIKKREVSAPAEKKPEANILTLYHWWTSSGESSAINALVDLFEEKYPNIIILPSPVKGGSGLTMLEVIKSMIQEGIPPDAFVMHAGYESQPYYEAGLLEPIDKIWKEGQLEHVIPAVIQDMSKFEGHYYSIPIDIHRTNVVWYNIKLLKENNIDPTKIETWDQFFAACDKLKEAGIKYPVQIASSWTVSHAFEQIMASIGIDFYEDWANGKIISANDPRQLRAIEIFKKYLSYANPDYEVLEWDEAASRIFEGEGAFYIMGDWVNGECVKKKTAYGIDYGAFPVPETKDIYGLSIDTFQHPREMLHHENADKWLSTIASKEGMDTFNSLKGSISTRTDADIKKYNEYQQIAMKDFWTSKYMFPSIIHGSGAPEAYKLKLNDIIAEFAKDKDTEKMAKDISEFTIFIQDLYTIPWSLQ